MELLRVEHLSKIYGAGENQVKALDDVSLSVEKGEFVAIVGASGSGKSTLLHLLGGVDRPTSGKVYINGTDIFAHMDDMLLRLGLTERRTHLPNELSGGQQQRTSIGRALITRPSIVLADEPTGNLDTKASNEIMHLLKTSNRELNQTIIMITHNMELAKAADRTIMIEDGKIR